jgi:hypothetical protein
MVAMLVSSGLKAYDLPLLELIGAKSLVFSSTQVEMIALISEFEYISPNEIGEEVQVHSDSSALSPSLSTATGNHPF